MTKNRKLLDNIPHSMEIFDYRADRCVGHAEFLSLIEEKATALAKSGVKSRSRVVLGIQDPVDFLVSLFGCWQIGACGVVVNPALASVEQERIVATINPVAWLGDISARFEPSVNADPAITGDAILGLMTSGTTGIPKGVMLSEAALQQRLALNIRHIGAASLQNSLCVLPPFFGHGLIGNCLTVLAAGGKLTLWPMPTLHELTALPEVIDQGHIGFMSSVPSFWKLALALAPRPNRGLQRVHIGSAPLSIALWEDIASWAGTRNIFNTYGMSETANWISGGALEDADGQDGYVGKPWGGDFAILSDGQIQAQGRGEVLVRCASMMSGYLGQPEKTAETLSDGWLHTGDIGVLNGAGALALVGRIKSEINVGGIKVLSEEVELMLERHPSIAEACAFPVPDAIAGERVGVAISCNTPGPLDKETVIAWCLEQARKEAAPKEVFVLESIPKNDRGKVVRIDVARQCLGQ